MTDSKFSRQGGEFRKERSSRADRPADARGPKRQGGSPHEKGEERGFSRRSEGREGDMKKRGEGAGPREKRMREERFIPREGQGDDGSSRPAREGGRPGGVAGALMELDRDIMKLLVRRAVLVSRMRGGRDHAATPAAIQAEKTVRTAWEAGAVSFSKDPKFTRQLFNLLQDIKVMSKEEAEGKTSFSLRPAREAVSGAVTGPVSGKAARIWMFLAAMLGKELTLRNVPLSDAVQGAAKALVQAGANIELAAEGASLGTIHVRAGARLSFAGKSIYAGDDAFTFHLLAFAAAGSVGTCRFSGGAELKSADFSGLDHTLPLLGARLAHPVPGSRGLPASLESCGVIPSLVSVPADLPADGIPALMLAALGWGVPITLDFSALPAEAVTSALARMEPVFSACGALTDIQGASLVVSSGASALPAEPAVPQTPAIAALLAALPALLGGSLTLKGHWPSHLPEAVQAQLLLQWAGLRLEINDEGLTAAQGGKAFAAPLPLGGIAPSLLPLAVLLAAHGHKQEGGEFALPVSLEDEDRRQAEDFLARLGLSIDEKGVVSAASADFTPHTEVVPWTCPDGRWGMAYALASCFTPGLKLSNPTAVTRLFPPFWGVYNSLPAPRDPALPPLVKSKDTTDDKPARRRIIAE